MRRRMIMGFLLLLVAASAQGCGIFGVKEHIVFVRQDLTVDGSPRQILKLAETIEADIVYYDGEKWIVVPDQEVPAGWLVVSPKVIEEEER